MAFVERPEREGRGRGENRENRENRVNRVKRVKKGEGGREIEGEEQLPNGPFRISITLPRERERERAVHVCADMCARGG